MMSLRRRLQLPVMSLMGVVALAGCGSDPDQQRSPSPSELASSSASVAPSRPRLPPPQGQIAHIVDNHVIDERGKIYGWGCTGASDSPCPTSRFEIDTKREGAIRLFGSWCWAAADRRVWCHAGLDRYQLGNPMFFNPNERPRWKPARGDIDGVKTGYEAWRYEGMPDPAEYVEARDADELYPACFRRGRDVYRTGDDVGCPITDTNFYPGKEPPSRPTQSPGRPGVPGTCWDPVKQPIPAKRLFSGCFALDEADVLHELFVLTPPREVARSVQGFARVPGDKHAILFRDRRLQIGGTFLDRPVREVSDAGVIFEDGTAAIWWSESQLLRPVAGLPDPVVELVEDCVLTAAKEVYCWPWHAGSKPSSDEPLMAVPATFVQRTAPGPASSGAVPATPP